MISFSDWLLNENISNVKYWIQTLRDHKKDLTVIGGAIDDFEDESLSELFYDLFVAIKENKSYWNIRNKIISVFSSRIKNLSFPYPYIALFHDKFDYYGVNIDKISGLNVSGRVARQMFTREFIQGLIDTSDSWINNMLVRNLELDTNKDFDLELNSIPDDFLRKIYPIVLYLAILDINHV